MTPSTAHPAPTHPAPPQPGSTQPTSTHSAPPPAAKRSVGSRPRTAAKPRADASSPADSAPRTESPPSAGAGQAVLRCRSTADFLAALPYLAGETCTDSLFISHFVGSRMDHTARIDLPPRDSPEELLAYVDGLCDFLRDRGTGASGPTLVIRTSQTFADCRGLPRRDLTRVLKRRFSREKWPLREFALVAPDGWAALLDRKTPSRKRELSEISKSPIVAQAQAAGAVVKSLDDRGRLPDPDPKREAAVIAQLAEVDARESGRPKESTEPAGAPAWVYGIARVADACFSSTDAAEPRLVARLIRASESTERWFVLLLSMLTDTETVIRFAENLPPALLMKLPLDRHATSEGSPGSERENDPTRTHTRERGPEPSHPAELMRDSSSGAGDEVSLREIIGFLSADPPHLARLDRARTVLADAAAHAPHGRRVGLLTLLAWSWWWSGQGSTTVRVIDAALASEPEHELALMIRRMIDAPPAWTRTGGSPHRSEVLVENDRGGANGP